MHLFDYGLTEILTAIMRKYKFIKMNAITSKFNPTV